MYSGIQFQIENRPQTISFLHLLFLHDLLRSFPTNSGLKCVPEQQCVWSCRFKSPVPSDIAYIWQFRSCSLSWFTSALDHMTSRILTYWAVDPSTLFFMSRDITMWNWTSLIKANERPWLEPKVVTAEEFRHFFYCFIYIYIYSYIILEFELELHVIYRWLSVSGALRLRPFARMNT